MSVATMEELEMETGQTDQSTDLPVEAPYRTDAQCLVIVRGMVGPDGKPPSRNAVMKELGVGTGRATKLIGQLSTGPRLHAVVSNEMDRPVDSPVKKDNGPVQIPKPKTEVRPVEVEQKQQTAIPERAVRTGVESPVRTADQQQTVDRPAPADREESVTEQSEEVGPTGRRIKPWPVLLLALPAFVAIWGGWVGLGGLTGFGPVRLLPGIIDDFELNTAITLPIGVEAYAAVALHVWLSDRVRSDRTRTFAMWSAIGSLAVGMLGQVVYHLMVANGVKQAPWGITTFVACLPVVVLGLGAALFHMLGEES